MSYSDTQLYTFHNKSTVYPDNDQVVKVITSQKWHVYLHKRKIQKNKNPKIKLDCKKIPSTYKSNYVSKKDCIIHGNSGDNIISFQIDTTT